MGDLVKALEADLFGAYEWAADQYGELQTVPQPVERVAVFRGLFRALEAIGREDDAALALGGMAEAEAEIPVDLAARLAPILDARERLLDASDPKAQAATHAPAYLAAFAPLWRDGPREALVVDALLAALVRANLLAPRGKDVAAALGPETAAHHAEAGDLYAAAASVLEQRVRAGEHAWQESARGAWNRAMVAWRVGGEEQRAHVAEEAARGLGQGAGRYR